MAPDSGLASLTPSPKSHRQFMESSMWKKPTSQTPPNDEDDSWEVRAFEEDSTGNLTWPPRSYTCTFCRREFRSAQALGGHMNVHRRDRARLHQAPPPPTPPPPIIIPNGMCLFYPSLPNPNSVLYPSITNPPSLDFSSSPLPHFNSTNTTPNSVVSSVSSGNDNHRSGNDENTLVEEEIDLELRLGRRQSNTTP